MPSASSNMTAGAVPNEAAADRAAPGELTIPMTTVADPAAAKDGHVRPIIVVGRSIIAIVWADKPNTTGQCQQGRKR